MSSAPASRKMVCTGRQLSVVDLAFSAYLCSLYFFEFISGACFDVKLKGCSILSTACLSLPNHLRLELPVVNRSVSPPHQLFLSL